MDLEKRVQALEQEVEVLKNQIQATLLDIQEQILTNTYPSLRSGSMPSANEPVGDETISSRPPVKVFRPETDETNMELPEDDLLAAVVHKVSLENEPVLVPNSLPAQDHRPAVPAAIEPQVEPVDWSFVDEWEDWVSSKVAKVGAERTRELIDVYCESGRFEPGAVDILLQLVDFYDGKMQNPFDAEEATRPAAPLRREPEQADVPAAQATANGLETAHRRSLPTESPTPDEMPRQYARTRTAARQEFAEDMAADAPPDFDAMFPGQPRVTLNDDGQGPEKRRTVLRLIAGLYNAGAGMKWSKKDG